MVLGCGGTAAGGGEGPAAAPEVGGLAPYCIKVETEEETQEFVEEVVEPPARIPVPVSDPLYVLSFPTLSVQSHFLQESSLSLQTFITFYIINIQY